MKVIIIEGIATSGKSLLAKELVRALAPKNIKVVEESQTHVPIIDKTSEIHLKFFKGILEEALKSKAEIVIFDRLYLSQAFRVKVGLDEYIYIENLLMPYSPLTVFLKIDENGISSRVQKAIAHRDPNWGEYVRTKGHTPDEIAQYYIDQQHHQLQLLKQSKIPYQVIDTSDHNYAKIAEAIAAQIT